MNKTDVAFEIVRLEGNMKQWEWERRDAENERYFSGAGKKAGLAVLGLGVLVILMSLGFMGTYLCAAGVLITLIGASKESSARERCRNLEDQTAWGRRRLMELRSQMESEMGDG